MSPTRGLSGYNGRTNHSVAVNFTPCSTLCVNQGRVAGLAVIDGTRQVVPTRSVGASPSSLPSPPRGTGQMVVYPVPAQDSCRSFRAECHSRPSQRAASSAAVAATQLPVGALELRYPNPRNAPV